MKLSKTYSMGEVIKNAVSLIYTKIFYKKARLIRMPIYIKGNKKLLKYQKGFTTGYRCRIDLPSDTSIKDPTLEIGENCIMGDNCHIAAHEKVKIGNNVLIASNVFISDLNHGCYNNEEFTSPDEIPNARKIYSKPVEIGDNVWIGEKVSILPGAKICGGGVIGSNSVVTKNIPPYSIAVGNPAKVIKQFNFKTKKWERLSE